MLKAEGDIQLDFDIFRQQRTYLPKAKRLTTTILLNIYFGNHNILLEPIAGFNKSQPGGAS